MVNQFKIENKDPNQQEDDIRTLGQKNKKDELDNIEKLRSPLQMKVDKPQII